MKKLLQAAIEESLFMLRKPNRVHDSYRAYWEGRRKLAEELLDYKPKFWQKIKNLIDAL